VRAALGALALAAAACAGGKNDNPTLTAPKASTASECAKAAGPGNVADHGSHPASGNAVTLTAADSFFEPTCTTDVPSGTFAVTVRNTGSALHNFSVPDQLIDRDVAQGDTIAVGVNVSDEDVKFFCKYHRTSGMVGALRTAG
jgi:plastocyanin